MAVTVCWLFTTGGSPKDFLTPVTSTSTVVLAPSAWLISTVTRIAGKTASCAINDNQWGPGATLSRLGLAGV